MKQFRTRSLQVAAFLVARDIPFLGLKKSGPNRVDLLFDDINNEASRLADRYYNDEPCSGVRYYRSLLDLRVRIDIALGRPKAVRP